MADKDKRWDGSTERRKDFCAVHDLKCTEIHGIAQKVDRAVPRWAFISALSTIVTLSIIFAGWHVSSLKSIVNNVDRSILELNRIHERDITSLRSEYHDEIKQLYDLTDKNRELLVKVKTIQENVLKVIEKIEKRQESESNRFKFNDPN